MSTKNMYWKPNNILCGLEKYLLQESEAFENTGRMLSTVGKVNTG